MERARKRAAEENGMIRGIDVKQEQAARNLAAGYASVRRSNSRNH